MQPYGTPRFSLEEGTLRVFGECAQDAESGVEAALAELVEAGRDAVVIDLTGVSFMASSCARYLVEAVTVARGHGCAVKVVAGGQVLRLVRAVQLDRIAEVVPASAPPSIM